MKRMEPNLRQPIESGDLLYDLVLAQQADAETLRKLFGGFLILVGLSEVFLKGLKKK